MIYMIFKNFGFLEKNHKICNFDTKSLLKIRTSLFYEHDFEN